MVISGKKRSFCSMRPMFLKKAADMRFKAADVKAADGVLRRPMFEKRPMDVVKQPTHQ